LSDPKRYPRAEGRHFRPGKPSVRLKPWPAVLLLLICTACGYRFSGEERYPGGVQRLFIEMLENQTSETGIEVTVTDALVAEFTRQRSQALAANSAGADGLLTGAVEKVTIQTISRRGRDAASQRRVTVEVALKLIRRDGQVVWAAGNISDNEAYPVSENKFETEFNRQVAISVLSERIAERVYNRFTDNF